MYIYACILFPTTCQMFCSSLWKRYKHSALIFEESIIHCSIQERNGSNSSCYNDFGRNTWFWVPMLISIIYVTFLLLWGVSVLKALMRSKMDQQPSQENHHASGKQGRAGRLVVLMTVKSNFNKKSKNYWKLTKK